MSFAADVDDALKAAVCGWLANGGNAVLSTFVVNGLRTPGTQVPAAAGGLGLLALNYGCSFDPAAGAPAELQRGCQELPPGEFGYVYRIQANGDRSLELGVIKVTSFTVRQNSDTQVQLTWTELNGPGGTSGVFWGPGISFELVPNNPSAGCAVPVPPPAANPLPPVTYVSPTTNCEYNVNFESWVLDDTGTVTPVVKIEAGPSRRAGGGVIGGCNFDPVIVIPPGGGGGGGGIYPWDPQPEPPDGPPWWWPIATTAIGNLIAAGIKGLVDELLQERAAGRVYRIVSVCETNEQGDPVSLSREVTIPTLPLLEAAIYRLDALEFLLQGHKDFKQPICAPAGAARSGEPVTVTFQSDGVSPVSGDSLIKQFKYFDQSGSPLVDHVAHWDGFTWQAGDVIVTAFGTPLGKPKVYAVSEAEGRRVIEHAASIAGVDLTNATWRAVVSADPRYGQPGVMRVKVSDGGLWVTKRSGPSGRPVTLAP